MKLIKIKTLEGKTAILNIAKISYWFGINETQTNICIDSENYFTVNISIEEFATRLEACDDSRFVWDF